MTAALQRYRILANVVGVVLVVFLLVAVPLRYLGGHPTLSKTVSPIHGALYIVLVVNVVLLGRAHRWPLTRIALVALGGTVPVVSFLVERRVAAREAAAAPTPPAAAPVGERPA